MYHKIQVVFDAAEPEKLAEFWGLALGYVAEPSPEGFASWEDFTRSAGIAESDFGAQSSRIDPAGAGPRLYFQQVPEGKTASSCATRKATSSAWSDRGRDFALSRDFYSGIYVNFSQHKTRYLDRH